MTKGTRDLMLRRCDQMVTHCNHLLYHLGIMQEIFSNPRYKDYYEVVLGLGQIVIKLIERIQALKAMI